MGGPIALERDEGEADLYRAGVEGEEALGVAEGVGADEEVGEDAAGTGPALFPAAGGVGLKRAAGGAPDGLRTGGVAPPVLGRFVAVFPAPTGQATYAAPPALVALPLDVLSTLIHEWVAAQKAAPGGAAATAGK